MAQYNWHMEMDDNCQPQEEEFLEIEATMQEMGNVNPYPIYNSIMDEYPSLLQQMNTNDNILTVYKLLGQQLFLIIEPRLMRQYGGIQTFRDNLIRHSRLVIISNDPTNPYRVAIGEPMNNPFNIVPEKYIKYAQFWIEKHECMKRKYKDWETMANRSGIMANRLQRNMNLYNAPLDLPQEVVSNISRMARSNYPSRLKDARSSVMKQRVSDRLSALGQRNRNRRAGIGPEGEMVRTAAGRFLKSKILREAQETGDELTTNLGLELHKTGKKYRGKLGGKKKRKSKKRKTQKRKTQKRKTQKRKTQKRKTKGKSQKKK